MSTPTAILAFTGGKRFLSNFYRLPIGRPLVDDYGYIYPTVEHAFQAAKTLDREQRKHIAAAPTPSHAKAMGRRVSLRADWEAVKIDVMRLFIAQKFDAISELGDALVGTGDALLVEGNNWHDNFWGICACPSCCDVEGQNWLGQLLMEQRDALRCHFGIEG